MCTSEALEDRVCSLPAHGLPSCPGGMALVAHVPGLGFAQLGRHRAAGLGTTFLWWPKERIVFPPGLGYTSFSKEKDLVSKDDST